MIGKWLKFGLSLAKFIFKAHNEFQQVIDLISYRESSLIFMCKCWRYEFS